MKKPPSPPPSAGPRILPRGELELGPVADGGGAPGTAVWDGKAPVVVVGRIAVLNVVASDVGVGSRLDETASDVIMVAPVGRWPGDHSIVPPTVVGRLPTLSNVAAAVKAATKPVLGQEHGSGQVTAGG